MDRLVHLASVLVLSTLVGYVLADALPGDAALAALGLNASADQVAALRAELGLDRPTLVRYVDWISHAIRGDFGESLQNGERIAPLLRDRFFVSFELMLLSLACALMIALPLAFISVGGSRPVISATIGAGALTALSTPGYVIAIALILLFSVTLGWLPASGFVATSESITGNLRSLVLPALCLAIVEAPVYLRTLERELRSSLAQPWVRTAQAYGASRGEVLFRHALRPSSLPFITLLGLNVGHMVAGAVVIETIFAVPGMGRMLVNAVYARDLTTIQACILVVATSYVVVNLLVDAAYNWLDPRVRASG
jgi:peptide/nickel transport system permease protein